MHASNKLLRAFSTARSKERRLTYTFPVPEIVVPWERSNPLGATSPREHAYKEVGRINQLAAQAMGLNLEEWDAWPKTTDDKCRAVKAVEFIWKSKRKPNA